MRKSIRLLLSATMFGGAGPGVAQTVLDRVDPGTRSLPRVTEPTPAPDSPVLNVEASTARAAPSTGLQIGAVRFDGLQALTPADFADVIEPFLGRSASPSDLADLAEKIAARARARGYVFATAGIEPQRLVVGVLTVTVDEGQVDEVRIDGPDHPAIRAALAPLTTGRPATLAEVERRLLIAGDIDGVWVRSARYVREGRRGVLIVKPEVTRTAGRLAISNDNVSAIGPEMAYARFDLRQLAASDDVLSLSYSGTIFQPSEFNAGRVRYGKRVSAAGTEMALSAGLSRSQPGAEVAALDILGRSWSVNLSALQPLTRRRAASLWLSAELDLRDIEQKRRGTLARADRLTVARLGLRGFAQTGAGRLRAGATVSRGLDLFGATRRGDPLATRRDGDGVFTTAGAWADWTMPLAGAFSIRAAAEAQVADRPLLVSEEFQIGGQAFLRGYDWAEQLGDTGSAGVVELRYDWKNPLGIMRRVQVYGFADGGRVINLRGGRSGGALASAGGGLRADITPRLGATFEVAAPLTDPRFETGDRRPRFVFSLFRTF
jgi:hemolysin activation/secretion protein